MQTLKSCAARAGSAAGVLIACLALLSCTSASPSVITSAPPGAPSEDVRFASEWPAPNGDLYNTRVAHSEISSKNVAQLQVAWTFPLPGKATNGNDFANPVLADGIAYLQDAASDVAAIRYTTGQVLWTHLFNAPNPGPNGVTIANGRIYGATATGVFALDAQTGQQIWYDTALAPGAKFDMAPQVDGGKVFVASALTVGGGILYALDAGTGATLWHFQTVVDPTGQQLQSSSGGAWDPVLIGPDHSVYAGTGNPYLSLQEAQTSPSRELYTDSLVKLDQATGKLAWYYQAFPDDFHDWDLQISPIYTIAAGRPVVLAAGKGGFVFAFDPGSGKLLWKTAVGVHNGHDNDDQQALAGALTLQPPYMLEPGEVGGVQTDMAAADGVVYVPVDNLPEMFTASTQKVGASDFAQARGEMVALDIATGKQLWATDLPQLPLAGATISNDLVFTATFNGKLVALSRKNGAIVWSTQMPAGTNAPLAIAGNMLLAGAGVAGKGVQPALIAYGLGAKGVASPTPATTGPTPVPGS